MIVEQFGGTIDFESKFEKGSKFYYNFELEPYQRSELPAEIS